MVVTIHTQHYDLTPEVKRFALENLHDPVARIWDREGSQLEIMLRDLRGTKGGVDKECRAILYMPQGRKIVITEVAEDMRTAIHQARKRLMRRVRQFAGERITSARKPKKYFLAKVINAGRFNDPTRIAASEEVRGAREIHG